MYREFALPYGSPVAGAIRESSILAYIHTCASIGDRLDLMAQPGVDGIDTLDPPPLGNGDLVSAKKDFGDPLFFKGYLGAVNETLYAGDEAFRKAVLGRLKAGMPGAGYILSSACSEAPHVSPKRLELLAVLAEEQGRYR